MEGCSVEGRYVEGRFVGRTFCSGGRFVERRFVVVPLFSIGSSEAAAVVILWGKTHKSTRYAYQPVSLFDEKHKF